MGRRLDSALARLGNRGLRPPGRDRAQHVARDFAGRGGHDESGRMQELVARLVVAVWKADRCGDPRRTCCGVPVRKCSRSRRGDREDGGAYIAAPRRRIGAVSRGSMLTATRSRSRRGRQGRASLTAVVAPLRTRLQRFLPRRYSSTPPPAAFRASGRRPPAPTSSRSCARSAAVWRPDVARTKGLEIAPSGFGRVRSSREEAQARRATAAASLTVPALPGGPAVA